MPIWKFKVNQQVQREIDVYKPEMGIKKGHIIRRYSLNSRQYPEVYEVIWNDGTRERGFLPFGLDASPEVST